ncbi:MAG: M43 family zinc metalloprotease [Flavobacteriaceae bacterium]
MKYLLILLILPLTTIAQRSILSECGNDIINPQSKIEKILFEDKIKNSEFISKVNSRNSFNDNYYLKVDNSNKLKANDLNSGEVELTNNILELDQDYVVPVVVHILHDGGIVGTGLNMKESIIRDAIEGMNKVWANDFEIPNPGDGISMNIKFKLAEIDENGNTTNGINRIDLSDNQAYLDNGIGSSGLEDYNDDAEINSMREYASWDPEKYYNIYVVNAINGSSCDTGGTFGYATYSTSHGTINDGVVMISCLFGNPYYYTTLEHELGHGFSLPHTFNGDLRIEDGIQVYGCGDDGIEDTAKHTRSTAGAQVPCNSTEINFCDPTFNKVMSPTKTGTGTEQDIVKNMMNYGSCRNEFTFGQQKLANSALLLNRTSYINSTALNSSSDFLKPDVSFSENQEQTGGTISWVNYGDVKSNTIYLYSAQGSFINGGSTTTANQINLDYIDQGMKHNLLVSSNYDNDIKRIEEKVINSKIVREYFDDFEDISKVGDWIVLNGGDQSSWRLRTNLTSGETIEGAWHILYNATTAHDDYLISPIIEVKDGITDGISFNAKNESMTWMEDIDLYVIDENYQIIMGTLQENITPPEEYLNYKFDLSEYEGQNIRIGFHSTTLDQYIFYMDDFKVGNFNTLSLNKIINDEISIYPNPVNSILKIDGEFTNAKIYDLKGKLIMESSESVIDVSQLPQSIYIIKVIANEESVVKTLKLIKE